MAKKAVAEPRSAPDVTYKGMERPWWIRAHHYKDKEEGIAIARAKVGDEKVVVQSKARERVLKAAAKAGLDTSLFEVTTLTPDGNAGNAVLTDKDGKTVARYRWSVGLSGAAPTLFKKGSGNQYAEVK